jgi:hypothetical protein
MRGWAFGLAGEIFELVWGLSGEPISGSISSTAAADSSVNTAWLAKA